MTVQKRFENAVADDFLRLVDGLHDPRRAQGLRYPLVTVVTSALMAMICGCDDAEAMDLWSSAHEDWLAEFLPMPHGSPSQDVYLAVFAALDAAAFGEVFAAWMRFVCGRLDIDVKHIAIDGKASRRSFDREAGRTALYTVSAWTSDAGMVLAQSYVEEKSNEIKAVPGVLCALDLRGTTVTIDAMGCQRSIARDITRGQGHYLLAVKDNQKTLHSDLQQSFEDALDTSARALDMPKPLAASSHTDVTKDHGRIETRTTWVCTDLSWLTTRKRWSNLSAIVMMKSVRTDPKSGVEAQHFRYFISSDADLTPERAAHLIRRHWGIENEVHWVLDMAFREDEARHRAGNCAANLGLLRKMALNLLKQDKKLKVGVANKRKVASWDREYLLHLLSGPI